jgi:hypothetical protein
MDKSVPPASAERFCVPLPKAFLHLSFVSPIPSITKGNVTFQELSNQSRSVRWTFIRPSEFFPDIAVLAASS